MSTTYNCGYGHSFTAKDANDDINPADIQAAVAAFNSAIDDAISDIGTDIEVIRPDACDAIRNYNKDMGYKFDELSESLKSMKESFGKVTENLYRDAVAKNKELQTKYNDEAKKAAADCAERDRAAAAAAAAAAGEDSPTTN